MNILLRSQSERLTLGEQRPSAEANQRGWPTHTHTQNWVGEALNWVVNLPAFKHSRRDLTAAGLMLMLSDVAVMQFGGLRLKKGLMWISCFTVDRRLSWNTWTHLRRTSVLLQEDHCCRADQGVNTQTEQSMFTTDPAPLRPVNLLQLVWYSH